MLVVATGSMKIAFDETKAFFTGIADSYYSFEIVSLTERRKMFVKASVAKKSSR